VSHIIYYVEQNLIHHKIVRIYCLNIALQDLYSSPSPPRLVRSRSRSLWILCSTEPTFPGNPVTSMGAWLSLTFFRPDLHPAQHHTTLRGVDESARHRTVLTLYRQTPALHALLTLPNPLFFTSPKGTLGSEITTLLIVTIPERINLDNFSAVSRSSVHMLAPRPY
jgi:hypothetical protein